MKQKHNWSGRSVYSLSDRDQNWCGEHDYDLALFPTSHIEVITDCVVGEEAIPGVWVIDELGSLNVRGGGLDPLVNNQTRTEPPLTTSFTHSARNIQSSSTITLKFIFLLSPSFAFAIFICENCIFYSLFITNLWF